VGALNEAKRLLKEARVPKELVVNATINSFEAFIARRKSARETAADRG
jgi:hypothetical protein